MLNPNIFITSPEAVVVGETRPFSSVIEDLYGELGEQRERDYKMTGLPVAELAGRGCYEAYSRKNEATDSHAGYMKSLIEQRHYSVLEHVNVSIRLSGISRADSHEIVRHRHFSFSQQSQRYVVVEKPYKVTLHPTLLNTFVGGDKSEVELEKTFFDTLAESFEAAEEIYKRLREKGYGRKQASEAARQLLPNAAATHMVVTGNLRTWMEFISKRDHPAADASMREVAQLVWFELKRFYPEVFGDEVRAIWDTEFSQGEVRHNDE